MTPIDQIRSMPDVMITAEAASHVLHVKPQSIRVMARTAPERLGFPVSVIGRSVLIPRVPFLRFLEGGDGSCPQD